MQEPRTSVQIEEARRQRVVRYARRGLVAGYLHSLSARHAGVRGERSSQPGTVASPSAWEAARAPA